MAEINDLGQYLDSSAWFGVGVLGVLLFLLGIYQPAFASLPDGGYLGIVVAIAGGAVAVMGFSFAYDRREYERRHPRRPPPRVGQRQVEIAPSLEIYQPGPVGEDGPAPLRGRQPPALPAGDDAPPAE